MNNYDQPLSTLEVHLDRVARNYLFLRKRMKLGADCAAVVKADAYGLGGAEVAQALFEQECRHFFVAHVSEAVIIRAALPMEALIYVLNGPYGLPPREFAAANFIPVLNTIGDIEYWNDTAIRAGSKLPCVIHIDTGMNRLGLSAAEVTALASRPELLQPLDVRYVMSHLACADEPQQPMNAQQLESFKNLSAQLGRAFRYSLANSAGIFLGEAYHFDLTRPGCALYGIQPQETGPNPMHGTVTLKARIVDTRDVTGTAPVGYGASYSAKKGDKLATISIGYADGYLRSLTGKAQVVIGEHKFPVVGRVSMDSIIVDVTSAEAPVKTGDMAEIIGRNQTVDEVAAQAGTIGYEILTSLGKRYKRIYTGT